MIKKILLIISLFFMSFSLISAQDLDMATILEMLSDDDALLAQDITQFQAILSDTTELKDENNEPILDENGEPLTAGAQISSIINEQIETLVAEGVITEEQATLTTNVVDSVKNATPDADGKVTLGQAIDDSGTTLTEISDSIASSIAIMAAEELFSSDPAMEESIMEGLNTLKGVLNTLTKFGQANAQTSISSSLYGHQGYNLFAASLGVTGSIASDMDTVGTIFTLMDSADAEAQLMEELKNEGFKAGVSLQAISGSLGLNLSWLVDRLYAGVVFGSSNAKISPEIGLGIEVANNPVYDNVNIAKDIIAEYNLNGSVSTNIFGITANYQLIKPKGIPVLFRWNGISVGTGVISNSFDINVQADLSSLLMDMAGSEAAITVEPGTYVGTFIVESNAISIPMEISTGVRFLSMINVNLGVGADLKFGNSDVKFYLDGSSAETIGTKIVTNLMDEMFKKADMNFPYTNPQNIDLVNLKAMLGVGIGLGPVSFDLNFAAFASPDIQDIGLTFGANLVFRI
ncbi:hypothetical protein EW093_09145 [Thiospirochaeta perfilievii]|uniref:Uncharacterized protein n=1 Tax=Thiospirochaeta perfilievii TaxID=252967 RepID=A0A5C1QF94_9SPIO|nr:hypothetical protein [Thiospirochaeta perfilievii]QEN04862.1 hypothetical protein EW093_09145 [Thiospirochaeta perfilievii]